MTIGPGLQTGVLRFVATFSICLADAGGEVLILKHAITQVRPKQERKRERPKVDLSKLNL